MPALAATLPVYLDHHATTPCEPRVVAAMVPHLSETYGNASSRSHAFGWAAEAAVEQARDQVAALLGCTPKEICFTSGATEADNLALFGVAAASGARGRHIVSVCTEHKAVLEPLEALRERGFEVTLLPVDADGLVSAAQIEAALRPDTQLVSVMAANNEIGTLAPLAEIGALCKARGVLFHSDAAQAAGHVPLDVEALGLDLVSLSAHKLYGPKGIGALYVRRRNPMVRLVPQQLGGGHERGRRAGTLPVHQIVGFGVAARIAREEGAAEAVRLATLRDTLLERLRAELPDVRVNGSLAHRLPNNLNVSFPGVEGEALLMALRDFALSSGAACTSATLEPSHVLRALGVPSDLAHASLRFGLGRGNTLAHVEQVAAATIAAVRRLRALREPPPRVLESSHRNEANLLKGLSP
jgi:cysteine desulfurase